MTESTTRQARTNRQLARLRATVRERDARLRELETRLAVLEASTTYQFGRIVVGAVRSPGRRTARLPRNLYRLWKKRDSPQPSAPDARNARVRLDPDALDRPEDRLLATSPAAFGDTDRPLVIAGVFGPSALDQLAGFASTVPLFPHDAGLVLESADADLLVVDTAAGAPGGPWAYLGEPGMYDREQALAALRDVARGRNLPVVLWEETWHDAGRGEGRELSGQAPAPGLTCLDWDAVAAPGVSLHRFNPGRAVERDQTPLVMDPGVRLPLGVRRSIDRITAAIGTRVVTAGAQEPPELPELLRRHAVTVAATPAQVLQQLACGAFVLCPPPVADALPSDLHGHVHVVTDPAALAGVLSAAERPDPRIALRTLFLHHATPVRLAALCERLGIDADPCADRRVAVIADVYGEADARRLADALLAQVHRPDEVVLCDHAEVPPVGLAAIIARLTEHGITVLLRTTRHPPDHQVPAAAPCEVTPGRAAWVAPWPTEREVPPAYLADLVCAAECSGADAIGPATGAVADYTFVAAIEPALMRRGLHESGVAPADWTARGARLVALDPRS